MKKILMIIAFEGFRDEECFDPKSVFESSEADVTIASSEKGTATGKLGGTIEVDMDYRETHVDDYDAVVFVGGLGASVYFEDTVAQNIAKKAYDEGKVVAAICIAPSILANAGLLEDKDATAYESQENNLKEKGANYTGEPVTVSEKIVTGNGPAAAKDFARQILELLD